MKHGTRDVGEGRPTRSRRSVIPLLYLFSAATAGAATITIGSIKGSGTVAITANNVSGLAACTVILSYTKSVVVVDNITAGGLGTPTVNITNSNGRTKIVTWNTTAQTGNVVIAYVTLRAVGAAGTQSYLTLSVPDSINSNAAQIPRTVYRGTFTASILRPRSEGEIAARGSPAVGACF
ncbi:MAG: hypothetical protein HYX75_03495 [Acidobacteria bacterium]|nr:hypothetical protein [Acidobacteriota bacterium]